MTLSTMIITTTNAQTVEIANKVIQVVPVLLDCYISTLGMPLSQSKSRTDNIYTA